MQRILWQAVEELHPRQIVDEGRADALQNVLELICAKAASRKDPRGLGIICT